MVRIPGQWFCMGCETGRDDEKPVHRVWVDSFELAACQVTNAEYQYFLAATNTAGPSCWADPNFNHPKMPVVAVSWHEAVAYCDWLSKASGKHYRLTTEAEWECAARSGAEGSTYPWGNSPPESLPDYANRWKSGPEPIGLYAPNAYGLYNLGDNVHEWRDPMIVFMATIQTRPETADQVAEALTQLAIVTRAEPGCLSYQVHRATEDPTLLERASRGGSWRHHIKVSRNAARSSIPPEFQYADYGFRIARSPAP